MFLLEPSETPYDLRFRLANIPVRVHPMFWVLSAAMGWSAIRLGFQYVLVWIACVFVSILIHELGHVLMGRYFGTYGHIVLYSFGGLAIGSNRLYSPWQRIAVAFAGPLAGFLFLGAIFGLLWLRDPDLFLGYLELTKLSLGIPILGDEGALLGLQRLRTQSEMAYFLIHSLIFINLLWGLLNLLPVWPLDGGQISRDLFSGLSPGNGARSAYGLSFVVSGLLAVNALLVTTSGHALPILDRIPYVQDMEGMWTIFLFGSLAFNSYQALQFENQRRPWERDDGFWDR